MSRSLATALLALVFLSTPAITLAAWADDYIVTPGGGDSRGALINPLQGGGSLWTLLDGILAFVIRIGAVIVVLMMVYVGYKFVTARGNETKITEARSALLWTVVGALILLGAQAISLGIRATVNALSVGG